MCNFIYGFCTEPNLSKKWEKIWQYWSDGSQRTPTLNPEPVHTLRHYTQDGSENLTLELKAWHCHTYAVLLTPPHILIHTCMNLFFFGGLAHQPHLAWKNSITLLSIFKVAMASRYVKEERLWTLKLNVAKCWSSSTSSKGVTIYLKP